MFYNQLEKLCRLHHTTPTAVTLALGLSKGTMSNWKKGATPNGEVVVRFSEHFEVTTDYLLKGVEAEKEVAIPEDPALQELLNYYQQFDELEKRLILGKVAEIIYNKRTRG